MRSFSDQNWFQCQIDCFVNTILMQIVAEKIGFFMCASRVFFERFVDGLAFFKTYSVFCLFHSYERFIHTCTNSESTQTCRPAPVEYTLIHWYTRTRSLTWTQQQTHTDTFDDAHSILSSRRCFRSIMSRSLTVSICPSACVCVLSKRMWIWLTDWVSVWMLLCMHEDKSQFNSTTFFPRVAAAAVAIATTTATSILFHFVSHGSWSLSLHQRQQKERKRQGKNSFESELHSLNDSY